MPLPPRPDLHLHHAGDHHTIMAAPDFTVAFHVGAHKTATSHLQRCMLAASGRLVENGVQYYGPDHFRLQGRTLPLLFGLKPGKSPRRAPKDQLALMRKAASRLVFSEENFIGVLNTPRKKPALRRYAQADTRIADLAAAVDCGGIDVFMGIRNPVTYLNSAYSQLLMGGQAVSAQRFFDVNPLSGVDWYDLVARMRATPGVNALTVWRYEDYAQVFNQITTGLVGAQAAPLIRPLANRVHVGLSQAAVARILEGNPRKKTHKDAMTARKDLPAGSEHPPFDGFSAADHAVGAAFYDTQIAAIRALSGVTFLDPPGHGGQHS